ncbi:MAG TPA: polyprenol monophosphomannose synthase [Candidatus Limnocylindrales bacterium]|nr:polyprenol monophosphomannose synthase [Candidatus Limnocylindrales bacterium]
MRKIVVIPTYNEKENLEAIVAAVLAVDREIEILVVDDNSPDGTGQIADRLAGADARVHVLHRANKEGLGHAYRAGLTRAIELGGDLIVQMDADFSHPPSALPEFFALAATSDLVLGSRYVDGITVVNWPMLRLMLSYFGNLYTRRVLGGLPVMDATGGFKCWRREALEKISLADVRANGYCFQIETTFRAWRAGLRIVEKPILFVDRKLGTSKMHISIALEALLHVWWLRLESLTGRIAGPGGATR